MHPLEQPNRWPDLQFDYGMGLDAASLIMNLAKSANSTSSSAYGPRFDGQMFYQLRP